MALDFTGDALKQAGGPGPMANAVQQAFEVHRQQKQKAIENLIAQQRVGVDQQRLAAETERARAQESRANAMEKRQQEEFDRNRRKEATAAIPQINQQLLTDPNQAQALGQASGFSNFQQQGPQLPPMPGPAPQEPQPAPNALVGPIPDAATSRQAEAERLAEAQQHQPQGPVPMTPDMKAQGRTMLDAHEQERQQQLAQRQAFEQQLAAHPHEVAEHSARVDAYNAAKQNAQQNPVWTAQGPQGPVTFDPNAQNREWDARIGAYAADLKTKNPALGQWMEQVQGAVKTGLMTRAEAEKAFAAKLGELNQLDLAKNKPQKPSKGAGGGAASSAAQSAETKVAQEIDARRAAGNPMSLGEMQDLADKYHLPHAAKAGHPSLNNILAGNAKIGTTEASGVRTQLGQQRLGNVDAALQATDAQGHVLGQYKSTQDAAVGKKAEEAFQQMESRLQALLDDIKANGNRVLSPDAVQRRESLAAAAAAAGRVYNQLGVSNANVALEKQILGPGGTINHGFIMGANPDVVQHVLDEARARHNAGLKIRLRAPTGGSQSAAPGPRKLSAAELAGGSFVP